MGGDRAAMLPEMEEKSESLHIIKLEYGSETGSLMYLS